MKARKLTPFGIEVKKALVENNMTQVQLAADLKVSPKYLSLILYGERSGAKYLDKIGDALGIKVESFLKTA